MCFSASIVARDSRSIAGCLIACIGVIGPSPPPGPLAPLEPLALPVFPALSMEGVVAIVLTRTPS
jgi:hypothetical protein